VVEQNVDTALEIADRAYVLDRGTARWSGDAARDCATDAPLRRRLLAA
jgi:ABC-type branched-subunit amino acid transport system ATPase component